MELLGFRTNVFNLLHCHSPYYNVNKFVRMHVRPFFFLNFQSKTYEENLAQIKRLKSKYICHGYGQKDAMYRTFLENS